MSTDSSANDNTITERRAGSKKAMKHSEDDDHINQKQKFKDTD
jgi:hypothetical protein